MNEAPVAPRPAPGKRISFVLAVLMHVLLAGLLIYGIRWQTQKPAETVAVELVRAASPAPTSAPEPAPEPPKPEPKPEPLLPKVEPKPEPPKPAPKPEIAQKDKEKPKPPPKPEPKPEPKPKPEPVKHDPFKDELERELKDAERRKALADAAQEQNRLKAAQASAAQAGEMDKYIAAIRGKVRGNIVLPPDIKGNPEALFEVTQLPSGEVLSVRLLKSSGHAAYDAATERAIRKSSPLPKPAKSELFNRTLELKFRPQDD